MAVCIYQMNRVNSCGVCTMTKMLQMFNIVVTVLLCGWCGNRTPAAGAVYRVQMLYLPATYPSYQICNLVCFYQAVYHIWKKVYIHNIINRCDNQPKRDCCGDCIVK